MENQKVDLFGEPIIDDVLLRDKFIEPPFSILDTKSGSLLNQLKHLSVNTQIDFRLC